MSAKRAAGQRGDLQKEKAPAIGGGPESCCELRSTLLRARPGPPSVVPEEAKVISRAKREVAHGANDIIGPRKCKGYGWDWGGTLRLCLLVCPDQLASADDVPLNRLLKIGLFRIVKPLEHGVEREQLEEIAMASDWRARSHVTRRAALIASLCASGWHPRL